MKSKKNANLRLVYKIHTARLRKSKWNLTLPISEARLTGEAISMSESQIFRWLDELSNTTSFNTTIRDIRKQISTLKAEEHSVKNAHRIRDLYKKLDETMYQPGYLCLIIDKVSDYQRACKGFSVNGVKYVRLLGTNGGIKKSTIVFIDERYAAEIKRRIANNRDLSVKLVPAKLEAYQALVCSSSIPVSMPRGVAIVDDCVTRFKANVINISDEAGGDPVVSYEEGASVELDESDGYGIMLPSLAERWSKEIGLDYIASGMNTRFSFEKGMVFTFDFLDFADKKAGTRIITDAWGNTVDLSDVELILTTSMVKLWDAYESCDKYISYSINNGYTFGVPKVCPKRLEDERALNYQFIQSYELSDEDIDELVSPTIDKIYDIIGLDWRKTLLYRGGVFSSVEKAYNVSDLYNKALMIEPSILGDPFIRKMIHRTISKRIQSAKIGVIDVHGNYSVVCGDPYALCQHMFGQEVTGLLHEGEIYNGYWDNSGATHLACFRAPMTCHNNIRRVTVCRTEEARYWFRYMTTCTLFNAWDTSAAALNGMDKDGDLVMLTDNSVLVRNLRPLPTLMCMQRKAEKKIVSEDDLISANINSFGDDIGMNTNRITSMYDVLAGVDDPRLKDMLSYRIQCGQHFQQNSIDKAKGIIANPMPREWYDKHAITSNEKLDEETKEDYLKIVADKKPYFMIYIYKDLMREYNTYQTNTNKNCLRKFKMTIPELVNLETNGQITDEQAEFLYWYRMKMPVGTNPCVMNRICQKVEAAFSNYLEKSSQSEDYDYSILKSYSSESYTQSQFGKIRKLYKEYNKELRTLVTSESRRHRVDNEELTERLNQLLERFRSNCYSVCSDSSQLCDIILDVCYKTDTDKRFAWGVVGDQIIKNLYDKNQRINYPIEDSDGDIEFFGRRFSIKTASLDMEVDY